jgi:hypothetical protein
MKSRSSSCPFPLSHQQLLQNQMIPNKATVNNLASHDPFSLCECPWNSISLHLSSFFTEFDIANNCNLLPIRHMALQPFVGTWPLFQFLDLLQSVGLLGRGISPSQGRYLHTQDSANRINAHRHKYLKWNSNPRFQCLSGRKQFMPYTGRPVWSAHTTCIKAKCPFVRPSCFSNWHIAGEQR